MKPWRALFVIYFNLNQFQSIKKLKKIKEKFLYQSLLMICIVMSGTAFAQSTSYTFSGKVTDTGNSVPISGASIIIQNTTSGTSSDFDGNYKFTTALNPGDYTLIVSYLGFATKRISLNLNSETDILNDVVLAEDLLSLDQVVVTGSSVGVNKRVLGNAISTIKSEDLVNNGATSVDQAITGKITGALVQQNSVDPAGGISIRLRGASTIAGSSDPLYIVDGIIISNSSNSFIDLGGNAQNSFSTFVEKYEDPEMK